MDSQIDKCPGASSSDIDHHQIEVNTIYAELLIPLELTRVDVFERIFLVFLGLGTLVGVVVVAYTLYNAYKYRDVDEADAADDAVSRPQLGELPTGGTGGKKLFLSFGISAIIVVSLIVWTYGMLLYVEDGPNNPGEDDLEVLVTGDNFNWAFEYEHEGETIEETNTLTVPEGEPVWVNVTAGDVWHAFGISQERVKADAIPGEYDQTWFIAEEEGYYEDAIECFELCGIGHSAMDGNLEVLPPDEFEDWLDEKAGIGVDDEADNDEDPDDDDGADGEADEDDANDDEGDGDDDDGGDD